MVLQNLGWLLHLCSKTKAHKHGQSLHGSILKMGSQSELLISNHLLNMYAKCQDITSAHKVFDEMPHRNLVSWSAMISGCDQSGDHSMALDVFARSPFDPNEYIYASAISACAALLAISYGQQLHGQSIKSGYASISFVSNSLISMYMNCRKCDDAFQVFSMSGSNSNSVVSYNAMIIGFAENSQPRRGVEMFKVMIREGVVPDQFSLMGVLGICSETCDLMRGIEFHCWAVKLGLDSTAFIGNVILTMYSKCTSIGEAVKVFNSIEYKDVISWNTIISASTHCGDHEMGMRVFAEMTRRCSTSDGLIRIDDFTFASVLAACAGMASIRHGGQVHAHIIRTRVVDLVDVGVDNALVNMYAKCGNIGYATLVFHRMLHRNLLSWNTMIAALGNHGLGRRAIEVFEQMKAVGVNPDSVTFIGLLSACNHSGLVNEGLRFFNAMKETHNICQEIEHFSCLVDLLGRAGKLKLAQEYVEQSQFKKDKVVLGSLLSACRLHGDVEIGECVARELLRHHETSSSSPYVLLSSLYAVDGRWEGVAGAWKMLKGSGVKKDQGHSLIEVKGVIEKFTVGSFSHPLAEEIMDTLSSLSWALTEVSL
ncbi:hypothetical protein Syun_013673 [Stephania yunnanensis]|uniref:Pentatricopeptide repeat-containing protein n=1 Tax=Stephania yunnanensis TaxID=152371 RepID=A0AAP0JJL2_9MAGN